MHLDLHLLLRGNAVEAAAACVTLDVDNAETIACVLADALECCECAGIDLRLDCFCFLAQLVLILAGFRNDLFEFGTLFLKNMLTVGK